MPSTFRLFDKVNHFQLTGLRHPMNFDLYLTWTLPYPTAASGSVIDKNYFPSHLLAIATSCLLDYLYYRQAMTAENAPGAWLLMLLNDLVTRKLSWSRDPPYLTLLYSILLPLPLISSFSSLSLIILTLILAYKLKELGEKMGRAHVSGSTTNKKLEQNQNILQQLS